MGVEPTSEAREAYLKARKRTNWRHLCVFRRFSNGFQLEQRAVTPNDALILTTRTFNPLLNPEMLCSWFFKHFLASSITV
jgi:hypothetical protein